jgi:hypothetical protein
LSLSSIRQICRKETLYQIDAMPNKISSSALLLMLAMVQDELEMDGNP